MGKIHITLATGSSVDKPLMSAFKANASEYVVFDNEMNGTMGLPIILVSKYENNKLEKINDQNEWNAVKECLRNIIAGNQMDYISVPDSLNADESFFSQLTLPVASFDALRANYNVSGDAGVDAPVAPATMETPVAPVEQPVMPEAPVAPEVAVEPSPVMPQVEASVANENVAPVNPFGMPVPPMEQPVMPTAPVAPEVTPPAVEAPSVNEAPVNPNPFVAPAPAVEPIPAEEAPQSAIDFTEDKEAFLKACENMFDALVAKFNK